MPDEKFSLNDKGGVGDRRRQHVLWYSAAFLLALLAVGIIQLLFR